jgi:predicted MFS family arabinose efflux permease
MPISEPINRPLPLAIGGLIALAAAMGIGRFVYTPILPAMTEALGLSNTQAGLIASANFLGYLVGALLAATPTLPGSRRTWLLASLAVSAVTTGAMGLMSSLPAFLALRFIGGVASAFVLVLASAMVLDGLALARRSHLGSVHFAGVGVGIAVSALAVSALIAAGSNWRMLWYGPGVLAIGALAAVAWLIRYEPSHQQQPAGNHRTSGPRGLTALIWGYGLFGFGYVVTATFLVAIVRASAQLRPAEPLVWLVVGLTAVPSVSIWIKASSRFGIPRTFSAACLMEAVGVAASVLLPSIPGVLLAAFLLGGTFVGLTALGLARARQFAPTNPRPVLARLTAAFGLGQIVGPSLAGYLFAVTGGFAVPSLLAAAALVAAAVIVRGIPL